MAIKLSSMKQGVMGIAGHAGVGHVNSINKQVQDDSAGFSTMMMLFKEATGLSLKLKSLNFDNNVITATMENGGVGSCKVRRPMTMQEKEIMQKLIGKEVINTHTLVLDTFGRLYSQGVMETPVACQAAIANAAANGFKVNFPEQFLQVTEDVGDNIGIIIGTVLDIDGIAVSAMATVNATDGGLGPNEDLEGNSAHGSKKEIMEALGMDKLPTLIVESMLFSAFSEGLTENTFFIRADDEDDNKWVRKAVYDATKELGYPIHFKEPGGTKRVKNSLREGTKAVANKIKALAEQLHDAEKSADKCRIVGELALLVSEDCGGVTYMSNDLHEEICGAGMMLRTAAVLNFVTTKDYHEVHPIPFMTEEIAKQYLNIVLGTVKHLAPHLQEATDYIISK